jgi:hypothetical protein
VGGTADGIRTNAADTGEIITGTLKRNGRDPLFGDRRTDKQIAWRNAGTAWRNSEGWTKTYLREQNHRGVNNLL